MPADPRLDENGVRKDWPTRQVIFHREGFWYPINVYEDDDWNALGEHAALNPGTLKITDPDGNILWRPQ
jgi:hypothetical protein